MATFAAEETREHRKELINALRSGYPRKHEGLCSPTVVDGVYNPHGYTLGGFVWKVLGTHSGENFDRQAQYLVEKCQDYYGFRTNIGDYTDPETGDKKRLFADHSLSFAQAADIIESEPEGLFAGNENIPMWSWDVGPDNVVSRESVHHLNRLDRTGERKVHWEINQTPDGYQLVTTITKTQVEDSMEKALAAARRAGGSQESVGYGPRMRHVLQHPDGTEEVLVTW